MTGEHIVKSYDDELQLLNNTIIEMAGLTAVASERVDAPYVQDAPAVLECELRQEVDLGGALNTLVVGEVVGVRLDPELPFRGDTMSIEPDALRPVGRLAGGGYALPGDLRWLARPDAT